MFCTTERRLPPRLLQGQFVYYRRTSSVLQSDGCGREAITEGGRPPRKAEGGDFPTHFVLDDDVIDGSASEATRRDWPWLSCGCLRPSQLSLYVETMVRNAVDHRPFVINTKAKKAERIAKRSAIILAKCKDKYITNA